MNVGQLIERLQKFDPSQPVELMIDNDSNTRAYGDLLQVRETISMESEETDVLVVCLEGTQIFEY